MRNSVFIRILTSEYKQSINLEGLLVNTVLLITALINCSILTLAIFQDSSNLAITLLSLSTLYFLLTFLYGRKCTGHVWGFVAMLAGNYLLLAFEWSYYGLNKGIALPVLILLGAAIPVAAQNNRQLLLAALSFFSFFIFLYMIHKFDLYLVDRGGSNDKEVGVKIIEHAVLAFGIANLTFFTGNVYKQQSKSIQGLHLLAEKLSRIDTLTQLSNRRAFFEMASEAMEGFRAGTYQLYVLMIDIDYFKSVNDKLGHAGGDEVLKSIAQVISNETRTVDFCARLGGEEFALIVKTSDRLDAQNFSERLRLAIENKVIILQSGEVSVTVSIGLASVSNQDSDIDDALERADMALYSAKASGRNRVEIASAL